MPQCGPDDWERTGMIIPVSKETFFNTKWTLKASPLCPYDMLYHPPDYDQKSARSDRKDPKIIRDNIWAQEFDKAISSTTYMMLGRPKWRLLDPPDKKHVKVHGKYHNAHMRVFNVLEWAKLTEEGKPSICTDF